MSAPAPEDRVLATPAPPAPSGVPCPNCNSPMLGPFCYACGQPKKGLIRHFSSIVGDFLDSAFNIDNRVFRTVGPLFFKPGHLSNEYFAGRRVRYVTPLRLYFFLSVIAFVVIGALTGDGLTVDEQGIRTSMSRDADELAQLPEAEREARLRELERSLAFVPGVDIQQLMAEVRADIAAEQAREAAQAKKDATTQRGPAGDAAPQEARPDAAASGASPDSAAGNRDARRDGKPAAGPASQPPGVHQDDDGSLRFSFNGKTWDPKANPLRIAWLPDMLNDALNAELAVLQAKLADIQRDPKPFIKQLFASAPQALFVILPVFALLLKFFYIFKRRFYTEHLIVALHSHSFLCLSLILLGLSSMLFDRTGPGFWHELLGWIMGLLWIWMPLYLLIMQKRVYRQGWIMTLLKYLIIGTCYLVLLSFGLVLTLLISLVVL